MSNADSNTESIVIQFDTNDSTKVTDLTSFCTILLALFTIVSFVANVFLSVTVLSSYRLRNAVINYFVLNLAAVNLIDVCVNMVFALLYISMGQWSLGEFMCQLNAFTSQIATLETLFSLVLLASDRAVALLGSATYKARMTPFRCALATFGSWLVALCFSFPVFIGSIPSKVFVARYFCSVAPRAPVGYPGAVCLFCILLPLTLLLLCFGVIFQQARVDRLTKRAGLGADRPRSDSFSGDALDARYTSEQIIDARRFQQQLYLGKMTFGLFMLYAFLEGPYIVLNIYEQIRNSKDVLEARSVRGTIYRDELLMHYPAAAETAITWLKFVYPVAFPFVVYSCVREIWKKFQDLICCRRTNIIRASNQTNGNNEHGAGREGGMGLTNGVLVEEMNQVESFENNRVPTLVATSGGLHLRTAQVDMRTGRISADEYAYADLLHQQQLRCASMDHSNVTSDYDSEDNASWANYPPHLNRQSYYIERPSNAYVYTNGTQLSVAQNNFNYNKVVSIHSPDEKNDNDHNVSTVNQDLVRSSAAQSQVENNDVVENNNQLQLNDLEQPLETQNHQTQYNDQGKRISTAKADRHTGKQEATESYDSFDSKYQVDRTTGDNGEYINTGNNSKYHTNGVNINPHYAAGHRDSDIGGATGRSAADSIGRSDDLQTDRESGTDLQSIYRCSAVVVPHTIAVEPLGSSLSSGQFRASDPQPSVENVEKLTDSQTDRHPKSLSGSGDYPANLIVEALIKEKYRPRTGSKEQDGQMDKPTDKQIDKSKTGQGRQLPPIDMSRHAQLITQSTLNSPGRNNNIPDTITDGKNIQPITKAETRSQVKRQPITTLADNIPKNGTGNRGNGLKNGDLRSHMDSNTDGSKGQNNNITKGDIFTSTPPNIPNTSMFHHKVFSENFRRSKFNQNQSLANEKDIVTTKGKVTHGGKLARWKLFGRHKSQEERSTENVKAIAFNRTSLDEDRPPHTATTVVF